jgi:hypothetical protein
MTYATFFTAIALACCPLFALAQAGAARGQEAPRATAAAFSDLSMERIRGNAATVKEYLDLLVHPEQATRLAAFEELTNSKDPAAQEAAYAAAFASSEVALRAVALRKRLVRTKVVSLVLQTTDERSRDRFGGEHVGIWRIHAADAASGALYITAKPHHNAPPELQQAFTVQGFDLIVSPSIGSVLNADGGCRGRLTLGADSQALSGSVHCFGPAGWTPFRASFNLR